MFFPKLIDFHNTLYGTTMIIADISSTILSYNLKLKIVLLSQNSWIIMSKDHLLPSWNHTRIKWISTEFWESPPLLPFMNILSVPLDHFSYGLRLFSPLRPFGVEPDDPKDPRSPRRGPSEVAEVPKCLESIPLFSNRLLFGGPTY